MKNILLLLVLLAIIFTFIGCESKEDPKEPIGDKVIYSGDIFPPENYEVSDDDFDSYSSLKEIGLKDENAKLVIYNLKRANCGRIVNIVRDSNNDYYNIYDENNKLFKLYATNNNVSALFDGEDNVIFAFIE